MDCIIDTHKDVRLLHLNGILSNRLSTDEAAADLFNKLCYQIHYACDRNYLHKVFVDVNKYYESRWNQWRARLMRDYFSNPWTIVSLMAAVLLLLLTVEQSFFTAYSYFPPFLRCNASSSGFSLWCTVVFLLLSTYICMFP
ncbi:hypothetical protein DsansV1_C03g0030081 [Dioscorea sansibarensis]